MNINQIINLLLDGDTDRAIVLLLREQHRQRNAPITVDADTAPRVLPPMVPINGGKKTTTIGFPCPTCHAKPGKPCVKMSTRGMGDKPLGTPLEAGKRHAARRKAWLDSRRGQ